MQISIVKSTQQTSSTYRLVDVDVLDKKGAESVEKVKHFEANCRKYGSHRARQMMNSTFRCEQGTCSWNRS